jgi:peptidoglycan/xylan/chitin deacetylase (PgdA/CDA1 family)
MFLDDPLCGRRFPPRTLILTFDDGPGPQTIAIAEYLQEQGISATFFVVGRKVARFPNSLSRLRDLGHGIGNHTFSHAELPVLHEAGGDLVEEIEKTDSLIKPYAGPQPFLFRAPYGYWRRPDEQTSSVAAVLNRSERLGHYLGPIHWDIDGRDWEFWQNARPVRDCAQNYLDLIRGQDHGIVLMHDAALLKADERKHQTLVLVKELVPILKDTGFHFVALRPHMPA